MACRLFRRARVLVLGLLPCLGCASALPPCLAPLAGQLSVSTSAKPATADVPPPAQAAEMCVKLAHGLEREGRDAEAVAQYELARHYRPDADVACRLAVLYDRLGDAGKAMPEYARALKEHPRDADLLNDLGYHHYNLGRWAEAEKYLRQALTLNAKHPHAWTNLGMTLAQEGRYPESLAAFKHCVSPAEAECNLAFLLAAREKRDEARAHYREALRLKPNLKLAQEGLAKLDRPKGPTITVITPPDEIRSAANATPVAKDEKPAQEPIRRVSAGPADVIAEAPPQPAQLPAGKATSGWVIPGQAEQPAARPQTAAAGPLPAPLPAPLAVATEVSPTPATPAAPGGTTVAWVPPPPVPPPALPPDLLPFRRPVAPTTH